MNTTDGQYMINALKTFGFIVVIMVAFVSAVSLVVFGNQLMQGSPKMYDCSIAEFSPDFTTAMRQECRKLRSKTTT